VHPQVFGIEHLIDDVRDELVGRPRVISVVIVAQGEIAEFHGEDLRESCKNRSARLGQKCSSTDYWPELHSMIVSQHDNFG